MELKDEIKKLIIDSLELDEITPEDIKEDEPLFITGLGLDSIDAWSLEALRRNITSLWVMTKKKIKNIFILLTLWQNL